MTTRAFIRLSDLKRMAEVAKSHNVTVWVEIEGQRVGVSPEMPNVTKKSRIAPYEDIDL